MSNETKGNEYAQAGVDYSKIEPFKMVMKARGRMTLDFPRRRHVLVTSEDHGACFEYLGSQPHRWCSVQEGLGNKNWIAEWMYERTGRPHYFGIAIDAALMAVNDLIAQGAMPVLYMDEVAAGDSEWFQDTRRAKDLADGFYSICKELGMALPAGESPSLRYLVRAEPPVKSAPSLSGSAIGIIAPKTRALKSSPQVGDIILGVPSSGLHANGVSLVIKRAMELPDQFLTLLPNGKTLGEEALIPTRSYACLMEELQCQSVRLHAALPGTGDGLGKLAFDKRPMTYYLHSWVPQVPPLFEFMRELGVELQTCLKTFNWGIGYYLFVPPEEVDYCMEVAATITDCPDILVVGEVREGQRRVIFGPEGDLLIPPPGDK